MATISNTSPVTQFFIAQGVVSRTGQTKYAKATGRAKESTIDLAFSVSDQLTNDFSDISDLFENVVANSCANPHERVHLFNHLCDGNDNDEGTISKENTAVKIASIVIDFPGFSNESSIDRTLIRAISTLVQKTFPNMNQKESNASFKRALKNKN